jgi:hypothetical protein
MGKLEMLLDDIKSDLGARGYDHVIIEAVVEAIERLVDEDLFD